MNDEPNSRSASKSDEPDGATPGYEAARDRLAEVVAKLETGGLTLDESLALWERGEELARICDRHLAGARERVDAALAAVQENAENGEGTAG